MEWTIEWMGMAAGFLTTCAFFPQVVKTVRSRSSGDLSWAWIVMMTSGVFLWMIYGYYIGSPSVFVANVITFFSLVALLFVKASPSRAAGVLQKETLQEENVHYVVKKRIVGRCCGCGLCDKQSCPRVVQYREKVASEKG
ncbi:MAG: SemiSWEET family sugar transporter [Negativicutes bacterium]